MVYGINFGAIDVTTVIYFVMMLFGLILALTFKDVMLSLRVKVFHKKGYGYIRMLMPDRQENISFVDLKEGTFKLFGRRYVVDVSSGTMKPHESEAFEKKRKNTTSFFKFVMGIAKTFNSKDKRMMESKEATLKRLDDLMSARSRGEYVLDLESLTMSGKYPIFTYRWDRAEPIDLMNLKKEFDSDLVETVVIKAKAQGSLLDMVNQNKKIMYVLLGILVGVLASAYFSYEVFIMVKEGARAGAL